MGERTGDIDVEAIPDPSVEASGSRWNADGMART